MNPQARTAKTMHMTYIRCLVANPASLIKKGDVYRVRKLHACLGDPRITMFYDCDSGREMCIPTDGHEVFFRVFVYGTLMKGQGNHRLLEGARFVGRSLTQPEFQLYTTGAFPIAVWLAEGDPDGVSIHGEVYEVDAKTLARLDRLEGIGTPGWYDRTEHYLRGWTQGQRPVFMYTQAEPRGDLLDGGDWHTARKVRLNTLLTDIALSEDEDEIDDLVAEYDEGEQSELFE